MRRSGDILFTSKLSEYSPQNREFPAENSTPTRVGIPAPVIEPHGQGADEREPGAHLGDGQLRTLQVSVSASPQGAA